MASMENVIKSFVLLFFVSQSIVMVSAYYEYTVENDRICSTLAKKRKVELGYNERSGLAVQETRYFNHWPGTYEFNCRFELKAIAKDGIVAVIQNLNLRRNATSGECIDFIQFKPELGPPSDKFCGVMSTLHPHGEPDNPELATNSFIDLKGELEVQIVIKKLPLQPNEKIDLNIVFTSYKLCAKNRMDYSSCGSEICIWKGFFQDGRVNCPLDDCKDEPSCAVNFSGVLKKEQSSGPLYITLVVGCCVLILILCFYLVVRNRSLSRMHDPQEESPGFDLEQRLSPSAPTLAETPKDKPPPYESLFPDHCH